MNTNSSYEKQDETSVQATLSFLKLQARPLEDRDADLSGCSCASTHSQEGPGRIIKNTTTYYFTIAVLIRATCGDLLCIFPRKTRCFRDPAVLFYYRLFFSPVHFPQENKVFQRPCRIILLPSYFFPTTVVNWYDRSIFNMTGSLG